MNEQKVRDAARVAHEIAQEVPEHTYGHVWRDVFNAMLIEPDTSNLATVAEVEAEAREG